MPAAVVLLIGITGAAVVDRDQRRSENAAVGVCAEDTRTAIRVATARLNGLVAYVRPTWVDQPRPDVRRGLSRMVSKAATGQADELAEARQRCAAVDVNALHDEPRLRRAACVRLLDRYATYLRTVVDDGARAFARSPEDERGC